MKFHLIDTILEQTPERIVALKQVSLAEEYLADHFPSFPILPGVLMIEAMVQAARTMLAGPAGADSQIQLVLGEVKALKFGNMVRPGEALQVEVTLHKKNEDGSFACKGTGIVKRANNSATATPAGDDTAVSGRFTMRAVRSGLIADA
jgi:3-hydroxyacyl-[acyl-carrier-protein] dehydratase